jgi:hypothetical protein
MSNSIFNAIKPLTSRGIDSLTGLPGDATIYADSNYGGSFQYLAPGNYDVSALKIGNDALSSLKVPTGLKVTLYRDASFQNAIGTYTSDTPLFPGFSLFGKTFRPFDNQTSSIKVELVDSSQAAIYKGGDYSEQVQYLAPGNYDVGALNIGNDALSSLKVPTGLKVTLYKDAGFQNAIGTYTSDSPFVGNTINDQTSSIKVEKTIKRLTIDNLTFSTNGQSIWGNGPAFTFTDNRFLGGSWNESGNKTLVNEVKAPRWLGGRTIVPRVGISGSTSGKAGLQSNLTIQGGTTNATLPIDIWIDLPSQIKAGDTVTIKSGFTIDPTATFSTLTPNAKYNLDLILGLNAQAGFQVGGSNRNLVNVSVPEKQINLLKLDGQNIAKTVDIPGGFGSFGLKVPNLDTTGTLGSDKKTLSSSKTDSFLNGNIDLDKIATSVLNKVGVPVPPFSGSVSANLGLFGGSFSYTLADFQLLAELNLKQKFDLVANSLKGNLTLSNAAKTKLDFTIGQDLTFTAPTDIVDGKLDLSASVNLGANLKNTTTLGGNSSLDISALAGSVSGSILGRTVASGGFGPLYQKNVPIIGGDIATIFNNQFALGGFNTQTFNAGSIAVV